MEDRHDYTISIRIAPETIKDLAQAGYRLTRHAESGDLRFTPPSNFSKQPRLARSVEDERPSPGETGLLNERKEREVHNPEKTEPISDKIGGMTRDAVRRAAHALNAAGLVVTVAGCAFGASTSFSPSTSSTPSASSSSASSSACVFGATTADVEVEVTGASDCSSWVQNLAGTGLNWQPITSLVTPGDPGTADSETMAISCVLDGDSDQLTVEDAGGQTYGTDICSREEQNGWVPDPTAEASDQASAGQAQASQAAASASASAQASTAGDVARIPQDDATVTADARQLESDLATYATDLKTADSDLAAVLAEPHCSGDSPDQNTYDDAQNVYDDGQAVYDDETSLTDDVTSSAGDLAQLESDLQADGETTDAALTAYKTALSRVDSIAPAQHTESTDIKNTATTIQNNTGACG
jgi:hypothetical protein